MRSDGDRLLCHLASAQRSVLLCAPFIKSRVLSRLLEVVPHGADVEVITRWHPAEVAAGVSDLEVLDVIRQRSGARLRLLDHLHAKLYLADKIALTGSANLTAPALGWCKTPNLEILISVPEGAIEVQTCVAALAKARDATDAERDRVFAAAKQIAAAVLPAAAAVEPELAVPWLPRSGGPGRLFQVYADRGLDRLTPATVESARYDLDALSMPTDLSESEFNRTVADRFVGMPAMSTIMAQVPTDLTDAEAIRLLEQIPSESMPPESQWLVVKEWFTHFLADSLEVAPQSYIVRRKPGASKK